MYHRKKHRKELLLWKLLFTIMKVIGRSDIKVTIYVHHSIELIRKKIRRKSGPRFTPRKNQFSGRH